MDADLKAMREKRVLKKAEGLLKRIINVEARSYFILIEMEYKAYRLIWSRNEKKFVAASARSRNEPPRKTEDSITTDALALATWPLSEELKK